MVSYTRVSIQGTMPGGEDWSVNPAFIASSGTQITLAQAQAWADAMASSAIETNYWIPQQVQQLMSSAVAITNFRVSAYTDATLDFYADAPLSAPLNGTGTATGPTQQALAVSLQTGGVGRSGRGRFYWPAMKYPIDATTGRFLTSAQAGTLADFRTMLVNIEGASPSGYSPELAVIGSKPFAGGVVTELRLGDVIDSQRRRKERLKEAYVRTPFPGA